MRNLSKETDFQSPLAAEPWLTTLVEAIKKEDHAVAEKEYQAVRRAELIAQNGPVFWRKFTDVLEVLFRQMEDLFGDHVTKGRISFTRSPYGGGISINKSAYPFVSFSATPNFAETTAHFTYTVVNPEIPSNIGVPGRFLPCRFGVEADEVVMSLDGTMFATPEAAAKFIMEKLFTIATSGPVVIHEPAELAKPTAEQSALPDFAWPHLRPKAAFPVFDGVQTAGPVAPILDPESPVLAAVEEVPVAETLVEAVVEPLLPPVSPLPPPLPFAAAERPAPASSGRAPLSKFFASASRLLGGGSAPGSRDLMLVLPPVAVPESRVPEAVSEALVAQLAETTASTSEKATESAAAPAMHEPVLDAMAGQETHVALEAADEKTAESIAAGAEPISLEEAECEDSSIKETTLVVASSGARGPRRQMRPRVARTRFRYQDPRRMLNQKSAMPVAVRPEPRPSEVRQAAGY
jgi:hypothetical protein